MAQTPKTFQAIHIYSTNLKKYPDGFCNHIFFASAIILIFGGLFLRRLSRLLKFKLGFLRVSTTDLTRRENKIQVSSVGRQERILRKATPKIYLFFCKISKYRICHILSSRVEPPEQIRFQSYGSSLIVDNSANVQI